MSGKERCDEIIRLINEVLDDVDPSDASAASADTRDSDEVAA